MQDKHAPPQLRLDALIDKQGAELAMIGREAITAATVVLPTANRIVDQTGGILRVHFTPGMQIEDRVLSVAFHAFWVCFDFPRGNMMYDMDMLRRSDLKTHHYVIQGPGDVKDREVEQLLEDARRVARSPLNPENRAGIFFAEDLQKKPPESA